jgi:hypothetical protein
MSFLPTDKFEVEVQKTRKYYDNISSGENNIVKFVISDDEIDYNLTLDEIYNLQFLSPITVDETIKNEIKYDVNSDPSIILDNNSVVFDLTTETQKIVPIKISILNGTEESAFIIENNYTDFISIVNTGSITAGTTILTDKYINSNYNILNNVSKYQLVGSSFELYITNNINVDQEILELTIYSMTYQINSKILIKF